MFEIVHINECQTNVRASDSLLTKFVRNAVKKNVNLGKCIISRFHQSLGRDLTFTMKAIWKSTPPTAKQNGTYNPEHQS